ncbi:MAG: tyrosine-type recombinase/integrase [Eubacteriales bacterium]
MATIYKRGQTYTYAIDIGKDGKGIRRKKTKGSFRTKKAALQTAAAIENDLASGTFVNERKIRLYDFIDQWFDSYAMQVKASTKVNTTTAIHIMKKYFAEATMLKDIHRENYQSFINDLCKSHKRSSVCTYNSAYKLIFKSAMKLELIKSNPLEYTDIPKKAASFDDDQPVNYLEKDELLSFWETVGRSHRNDLYTMFFMLFYTGVRVGELVALSWSDIDFENKLVSISKDVFFSHAINYVIQPPKTKSSKRKIPITDSLLKVLSIYKKEQQENALRKGIKFENSSFIFAKDERPFHPTLVNNYVKKYIKMAGINKHITTHGLRHTHVSLLAEAGVSLEAIQERLGHKSDTTARDIYLHITKKAKKEAAQKFDKLMNG